MATFRRELRGRVGCVGLLITVLIVIGIPVAAAWLTIRGPVEDRFELVAYLVGQVS